MKHSSVQSVLMVTLKTQLQNSSAKIKKLFDLALIFILATYSSENFFTLLQPGFKHEFLGPVSSTLP